jgi:hypothetical protein
MRRVHNVDKHMFIVYDIWDKLGNTRHELILWSRFVVHTYACNRCTHMRGNVCEQTRAGKHVRAHVCKHARADIQTHVETERQRQHAHTQAHMHTRIHTHSHMHNAGGTTLPQQCKASRSHQRQDCCREVVAQEHQRRVHRLVAPRVRIRPQEWRCDLST